MAYSVRIDGLSILGGGITAHCAYHVSVTHSQKGSWRVYRRFHEFEELHKTLMSEAADVLVGRNIVLPEKGYGGSFYSSQKWVTDKRQKELEQYVQALVAIDPYKLHSALSAFLDVANKGASGARLQLGDKNIVLENFLNTKPHLVFPWSTKFVVLTKGGSVYCMRSVYDDTSKALVTMELAGGAVKVEGRSGSLIADLTKKSDGTKLTIQFHNRNEMADWLRCMADFESSGASKVEQQKGYRAQKKEVVEQGPVTDIRAKGTGATTDELSNMYGL